MIEVKPLLTVSIPGRDVERGRELDITEAEIAWAREKMAGQFQSDAGFACQTVAYHVRMLLRSDLHHEMICTMARDRIARLVLEVVRLREELAKAIACAACGGSGVKEVYGGHGTVIEMTCVRCAGSGNEPRLPP